MVVAIESVSSNPGAPRRASVRSAIGRPTGSGMSNSVRHRSKPFDEIILGAEADIRKLAGISDDYHVLFLQGGATTLAALLPLNLAGPDATADYLLTGHWGEKALENARPSIGTHVVASSKDSGYKSIAERASWQLSEDAAYFHYTPNETIHGVEFHDIPDVGNTPLVRINRLAQGIGAQIVAKLDAGSAEREAAKIVDLLQDPRTTGVHLVTLAEEMPVAETLETCEQLRGPLGARLGPARLVGPVGHAHRADVTAGPARPHPRGQVDHAQVPLLGGAPPLLVGVHQQVERVGGQAGEHGFRP